MAPRRSQRLHSQFRGSQEGAGMAPRRSPRIQPQIHASQEDAGTARRRITRLRAQSHAREQGAGVTRLRRCRSPAAAELASLPDDMLREILLRLPPQPSSLPRVSAVCKRWRGLVADPRFLRRFYAHHRKPPILGVFSLRNEKRGAEEMVLNPILDPPDRILPKRISFGTFRRSSILDCRHGLVLIQLEKNLVVCDPIARKQHRVAVPPALNKRGFYGVVFCAAGDQGHVHGACHSSPFKVVLLYMYNNPLLARVYSSETDIWSDPILSEAPGRISSEIAVLVGNCIYWMSYDNAILEFDMGEHRLAVISGPPVPPVTYYADFQKRQIIQVEDGALGYAILSYPRFQIWQRNINGHGVATWVPWKTIEIDTIPGLPSLHEGMFVRLLGYDDDAVFLCYGRSVYMVQVKSMQSKKLNESCSTWNTFFPFKSFFTPGAAIAGGFNGAEMWQIG